MTAQEKIEAKEELERLRQEGKFTELILPDFEPTERDIELDLLDRKCDAWVNNKIRETRND